MRSFIESLWRPFATEPNSRETLAEVCSLQFDVATCSQRLKGWGGVIGINPFHIPWMTVYACVGISFGIWTSTCRHLQLPCHACTGESRMYPQAFRYQGKESETMGRRGPTWEEAPEVIFFVGQYLVNLADVLKNLEAIVLRDCRHFLVGYVEIMWQVYYFGCFRYIFCGTCKFFARNVGNGWKS